jgi:hypothetical protein
MRASGIARERLLSIMSPAATSGDQREIERERVSILVIWNASHKKQLLELNVLHKGFRKTTNAGRAAS